MNRMSSRTVYLAWRNGVATGSLFLAFLAWSQSWAFDDLLGLRLLGVMLICTLNSLLFFRIQHGSRMRFAESSPRAHAFVLGALIAWFGTPLCGLAMFVAHPEFNDHNGTLLFAVGYGSVLATPLSIAVGGVAGLVLERLAPRSGVPVA